MRRQRDPHGTVPAYMRSLVAAPPSTDECVLWPFGRAGTGYGNFYDGAAKAMKSAHRYVCEQVNGPAPFARAEACHSCGVKLCVNPRHLYWGTRTQNERDKHQHGSDNRGQRNGQAKLTVEQVRLIRSIGSPKKAASIVPATTERNCGAIIRRDTWAWLDAEPVTEVAS